MVRGGNVNERFIRSIGDLSGWSSLYLCNTVRNSGIAFIINPILLAVVITITALPVPGLLAKRGVPGWLGLVLTILAFWE